MCSQQAIEICSCEYTRIWTMRGHTFSAYHFHPAAPASLSSNLPPVFEACTRFSNNLIQVWVLLRCGFSFYSKGRYQCHVPYPEGGNIVQHKMNSFLRKRCFRADLQLACVVLYQQCIMCIKHLSMSFDMPKRAKLQKVPQKLVTGSKLLPK